MVTSRNSATVTSASQAPSVNLVIPAVMKTTAESSAPVALKHRLLRQCRLRARHQCTTMPLWESVKARKTPTAYSGISESVLPSKAT